MIAPRPARIADCDVLAEIHAKSFPAPWTPVDFATLLAQAGIAGWIAGNPPHGLLLVRAAADEAEILTIAVSPEMRRGGVASTLVAEAIATLRRGPTRRLFLEVAEDNMAARALYRRIGFSDRGRRKAYYAESPGGGRSTDALIMALDLAGSP